MWSCMLNRSRYSPRTGSKLPMLRLDHTSGTMSHSTHNRRLDMPFQSPQMYMPGTHHFCIHIPHSGNHLPWSMPPCTHLHPKRSNLWQHTPLVRVTCSRCPRNPGKSIRSIHTHLLDSLLLWSAMCMPCRHWHRIRHLKGSRLHWHMMPDNQSLHGKSSYMHSAPPHVHNLPSNCSA